MPAFAGKTPNQLYLIIQVKDKAFRFHGNKAATRLNFTAIDGNIQRQAGSLVVQPVGAQVANDFVQRYNSADNQLLITQRFFNRFIITFYGDAEMLSSSLSSSSRNAVASNFKVQVYMLVFPFVCVTGFFLHL